MKSPVPAGLGYYMPVEWRPHSATWLSWPKDPETWPDRVPQVEEIFLQMMAALAQNETVNLLVDNEETERAVRASLDSAAKLEPDFVIAIAEDGSTDGTYEIAQRIAASDSRVRVFHSESKLGRGEALRNGWSKLQGEIYVCAGHRARPRSASSARAPAEMARILRRRNSHGRSGTRQYLDAIRLVGTRAEAAKEGTFHAARSLIPRQHECTQTRRPWPLCSWPAGRGHPGIGGGRLQRKRRPSLRQWPSLAVRLSWLHPSPAHCSCPASTI